MFLLDSSTLDWHKQAACHDVPHPDIFFPESGESHEEAKAICRSCLVRTQCLEEALSYAGPSCNVPDYGIWGGTTPAERRQMRGEMIRNRLLSA